MPSLTSIAEGKPFRTPLHPALVHLPLALFPLSVILDIAGWFFDRTGTVLGYAAFIAIVAGLGTGLVAGIFGLVDYCAIRRDHPARRMATLHLALNLVALGFFASSAALRYHSFDASRVEAIPFLLSLAGLVVLAYSGYLGGKLVYDDGIGVGRHRSKFRTAQATRVVRTGDPWAPVADENELREGEILRADVNGTVIAIARVGAALHAFQEFCPHRYGPLSEGQIEGCEVICPWHRSRFDVRTGEVTSGPAKISLRTFRIQTRAGKIWVEAPQPSSD